MTNRHSARSKGQGPAS